MTKTLKSKNINVYVDRNAGVHENDLVLTEAEGLFMGRLAIYLFMKSKF